MNINDKLVMYLDDYLIDKDIDLDSIKDYGHEISFTATSVLYFIYGKDYNVIFEIDFRDFSNYFKYNVIPIELLNNCILEFRSKKLRNSSTYGKFGDVNG